MKRIQRRRSLAVWAAATVAAFFGFNAPVHAVYSAKKTVGGLNQPTYVAQAPGDNTNLYIVQRSGTGGTVGDILKYNPATNTKTPFLNIAGSLVQDGGLLSMAFHPDYATNGLFYVTSLVGSQNRLEEYKTTADGSSATLQRTLLAYNNLATQHTIDWVGFKPNVSGAERNYLYVTTGDGGIQANEANFLNRGQDPTTVMGKVLRLDVNPAAPDAYPADANKNFAIPAINPFVNDTTGKLKEVFVTGHRNPWRASFDRATGDMYVGDVGFNTKEEVDFNKNDAGFNSGRDYGWAKREGTLPNPIAAFAGAQGNSLNPIFEVNHPTFSSVTGGYVYRGDIVELQGKYLFGDFNSSKIYAMTFDRDTDPTTFNGSTAGVSGVADITSTINSLITASGGGGAITGLVSFGEDNAGNLMLLSLGTGNIFNPTLGTGSVYTLSALPVPTWNVAASGSFTNAGNWSTNSVPAGATAVAKLAGPAGSGTRVVDLSSTQTLMQLTFDNATASYDVAGPGTLAINANPQADALIVASGSHAISAPLFLQVSTRVNIAAGSTLTLNNVSGAPSLSAIVKRGAGTLVMPASDVARYAVDEGTLRLTGTGNARTSAVAVATGGVLDVTGSTLIVDYTGTNPLAALRAQIVDGRIGSSTLGGAGQTIGYFDTSVDPLTSFNGATGLDASTLILRGTLRGDTNLDRVVNFDDLLALARNYGGADKLWQQGDADHNGTVDFDDLLAQAKNYNGSIAPADLSAELTAAAGTTFAADWALAVALVPEPTSLAALVGLVGVIARRRR